MRLINKYIFMLLFVTYSMNAMNEKFEIFLNFCSEAVNRVVVCLKKKEDSALPCDNICHFNHMPVDVLNRIAGFLMESEEEFVARMRNIYEEKQITNYYGYKILDVFCPDNFNSLSARSTQVWYCSWLTLHKSDDKYKGYLDTLQCKCTALSRHMDMIAILGSERADVGTNEVCAWDYVLEIQKIDLKKDTYGKEHKIIFGQQRRLVCHVDCPNLMGFNKQGTLFMVCKKNSEKNEWIQQIYDLKKEILNDVKDDLKVSNQLQQYFRDNKICNNYIKGTGK